jgi:hypothetical protein
MGVGERHSGGQTGEQGQAGKGEFYAGGRHQRHLWFCGSFLQQRSWKKPICVDFDKFERY